MELDPDTDLDEISLGERYGVSRTPVRETFRRLAGEATSKSARTAGRGCRR